MKLTTARMNPVVWVGTSRSDLSSFPEDVKDAIAYALYVAQRAEKHVDVKHGKGYDGTGILEILEEHAGDTYRAVYTVGVAGRIYVLHALGRKSKTKTAAPGRESELSRRGTLRLAPGSEGTKGVTKKIRVEEGSGNIFADIGLPNPEERLVKLDLAIWMSEAICARRLKHTQAARTLEIDQARISQLLHGQLSGFSTERLMHFLTLLGRDVEITVKPIPRSRRRGHFRVLAGTIEGKNRERRKIVNRDTRKGRRRILNLESK